MPILFIIIFLVIIREKDIIINAELYNLFQTGL